MTETTAPRDTSTSKTLKKLLRTLPGTWMFTSAIAITVVLSGVQILFAHLLRQVMDTAVSWNVLGLAHVAASLVFLAVCESAARGTRTLCLGRYMAVSLSFIRRTIAEQLASSPPSLTEEEHLGDYLSRLTNDTVPLSDLLTKHLPAVIFQALAAISAFIYLAILNWRLAIVCSITGPLLVSISSVASRPIGARTRDAQERLSRAAAVAQDFADGAEIVRIFGLNHRFRERHDRAVDESVESSKTAAKSEAILLGISFGGGTIPYILLIAIGGYWVVTGRMTPGSLTAFIQLMNHLTSPMSDIPNTMGSVRRGVAAAARVFDLLDLPEEKQPSSPSSLAPVPLPDAGSSHATAVLCHDLSFTYPGRTEPALDRLNLEIFVGEVIAIVGPVGCGKSTLAKLLLGFYKVTRGDLEVFGQPVSRLDLRDLRSRITIVEQNPYLFPGSIRENIGYGNKKASGDEIVAAAKIACAQEFIERLPNGYDTDVGELGDRLSGGEKQRIAIARAVLKGSPIVILDEATSFLDNATEQRVLNKLSPFLKGRTCLIIAHRLSSAEQASRIFVLNNGSVSESGSRQELLRMNGLYAQLYGEQSKEMREG